MIILCDTREKHPLNFSFYDKEMESQGLKTGDYSVKGFEDKICIERKRNTGELSINLGSKWKQFSEELLRMCIYPHKVILCEFPEHHLDTFPKNSGIPEKHWSKLRISSGFLKKRLYSIPDTYDIEIVFTNSKEQAEEYAVKFLEKAYGSLNG